jgi:hypothetical protein
MTSQHIPTYAGALPMRSGLGVTAGRKIAQVSGQS